MNIRRRPKGIPVPPATEQGNVLLLVDWDNLFYGISNRFSNIEERQIGNRLKKLIEWIETEIGPLLGGYGFMFAPEHFSYLDLEMCKKNSLKLMICPKKPSADGGKEIDTVDEQIIWFARMMADHPSVKTICLVSSDSDFVPLFEELGRLGIKRALAPPTLDSLSKTQDLIALVDNNSKTHRKMLLVIENIAV